MEIYLMEPYNWRYDKNPKTTLKVWAAVAQDVFSGAGYIDVVWDYPAQAVLEVLRKLAFTIKVLSRQSTKDGK